MPDIFSLSQHGFFKMIKLKYLSLFLLSLKAVQKVRIEFTFGLAKRIKTDSCLNSERSSFDQLIFHVFISTCVTSPSSRARPIRSKMHHCIPLMLGMRRGLKFVPGKEEYKQVLCCTIAKLRRKDQVTKELGDVFWYAPRPFSTLPNLLD